MKATLTRSGATGYSTANWKSYDVWGGERASTGSGSMFGYCGNLGHPTDPENGLIYMRARFYEPWTGRFLNEDPANEGANWYVYSCNKPSSLVDQDGRVSSGTVRAILQVMLFLLGAILMNFELDYDSAFKSVSRHIMQTTSQIRAGLMETDQAMRDIMEEHKKLQATRKRLEHVRMGKKGMTYLTYVGYGLLLRSYLMEIDFGTERSGLDWLFDSLGEK